MESVTSPEVGAVGALGWQVHPRVGSNFQNGEDDRSLPPDGDEGKLKGEDPFELERGDANSGDDDDDDAESSGSEPMDWALQWKQHREYEAQRLLDANNLLDSPTSSASGTPAKLDSFADASIESPSVQKRMGSPSSPTRHVSPAQRGARKSASSMSFVERAHAFMNARDTKVSELARDLEQKSMQDATFQPRLNANASSPVGAPRDVASRTRLHQEQRDERVATRAAQLKREEASRMRSKPRLVSKQQYSDATPVVQRLYAAGERNKQKRNALRKSLDERDEADGQLLFHPRLTPTKANPLTTESQAHIYGTSGDDGQPRLYREAKAREKRAVERRREADQALADAAAVATRQSSKSAKLMLEKRRSDMESIYSRILKSLDDSVTLPPRQRGSPGGLMYSQLFASILHLLRSKFLRVQSNSVSDEDDSAFVAQVVWKQLQMSAFGADTRLVGFERWKSFAMKFVSNHVDRDNVVTRKSTAGVQPLDKASPALGAIVNVISGESLKDRARTPPPAWRFPDESSNDASEPMERIVENTGGVSTAPVVPISLDAKEHRAICTAFVAACVRWIDFSRSQEAAAKKSGAEACTFSPVINKSSRKIDQERQRQLAAQEYTGNTVEPGLSTEVVSASAAKTRRPGTKQSRADQMLQKHREAQARLMLAKAKKEEEEQEGLTFKPKVKGFAFRRHLPQSEQPPAPPGVFSGESTGSEARKNLPAHVRLYKSANSNAKYLEAERQKLKEKEVEGCTFQPDRVTKRSYKNRPPAPPLAATKKTSKAVSGHIERMKAAQEKKEQLKLIENQVGVYSEETYQKSQMNKEVVPFQLATDRRREDRERNTPALFLDVNMGKGKTGRIGIAPGDSSIELAENFAAVHSLRQAEAAEKLAHLIRTTAESNGVRLMN